MIIPLNIRVYQRLDRGHKMYLTIDFMDVSSKEIYSITEQIKGEDIGGAMVAIGKEYQRWLDEEGR